MNEDDYLDELYDQQNRHRLLRRLAHLPPGDPDEEELLDLLGDDDE